MKSQQYYTILDKNYETVARLGNLLGLVIPRSLSPFEESCLIGDDPSLGNAVVQLCRFASWNIVPPCGPTIDEAILYLAPFQGCNAVTNN